MVNFELIAVYKERVKKLRSRFNKDKIDAVLIVKEENRRYLSGFTGSDGILLITGENNFILTDSRYHIQVKKEAPDFKLIDVTSDFQSPLSETVKREKIRRLGFESYHLSFQRFHGLKQLLDTTELIPVTS